MNRFLEIYFSYISFFFLTMKNFDCLEIIFIDKYDKDEANIGDIMAASKGLNPINNNSYRIIHRYTLLIISNIDHANIIFFIICFRILKLI